MKPYTKKQIKAMQDAIVGAWLVLCDMGMPAAAFSRGLGERRLDIVLGGIRGRVTWHERHAAEDRATSEYFRAHPEIYGDATPEMVARFEALAVTRDKGAAWFRALLERVERDGLPSEVEAFDPTAAK